ncbi:MAG: hypothetical protein LBR39_04240 [Coriobacteriales bacterium]|jgi:hypothetical protein|nr:hypothetical protein [Coriobacteriales bacterium]
MDTRINDRLARSGRVLDIIGKVLAILCIIGAVAALFTAIAVAVLPEDLITGALAHIPLADADLTVKSGGIESDILTFPEGAVLADYIPVAAVLAVKVSLIAACAAVCIYCLIGAIILFILSAVFKATAINRTPFVPENVKRLKIIGIILIVVSILLGLTNLVFAFCVFALAYVFEYGAELQKQADETL